MKTPIQKLIQQVEKRISFHSQAQTLSNDPSFHMGALQEAVNLKEQLLQSLEYEKKCIIESCNDGLFEPWVISGIDYFNHKYEKETGN
jgi:hypothetical protein